MNEHDLLKLKEQIEKAKQEVNELKGQQTALFNQLKEEFNCNSIEDAERLLTDLTKEIQEIQESINKGLKDLESKFPLI